jgi:transposase
VSLKRQVKQLKKEVSTINEAIEQHLLAHPELQKNERLLRSIDGFGRQVAMVVLAEVPDINAFGRARELAAFAGLTPSLAESGTSVRRRGRMNKEGSALLRKMLYMAALQAAKRTSNAFHQVYQDFIARGKSKMCAIGAIMHKLLRVAFGVLKHQTRFVISLAKI